MNLLILDIDETLIYGTEVPLAREPDFMVGPFSVYRRPHLQSFVETVSMHFELAVWTSASRPYALEVIANLDFPVKPSFIWASERCTQVFDAEDQSHYPVKNLGKLKRQGYDLDRVIMVDNTPRKLSRNFGNLVRVTDFVGDPEDDELHRLASYLIELADCSSLRSVEKRGWRKDS